MPDSFKAALPATASSARTGMGGCKFCKRFFMPRYKAPLLDRECVYCKAHFKAKAKDVARGGGKYCSRDCLALDRKPKSTGEQPPNATCAYCGVEFFRKKFSEAKSGLRFCCKDHRDKGQQLEHGIKAIWPDHYGKHKVDGTYVERVDPDTRTSYRKTAKESLEPKCSKCGYDKYPAILQVHHKDSNRDNNHISNLEMLCPRCHSIHHLVAERQNEQL